MISGTLRSGAKLPENEITRKGWGADAGYEYF